MALKGRAALAMWWDVASTHRQELEHWHAHEHVPERLSLPGFLRASRWTAADGGDGFFMLYELHDHAVLASDAYVARLNAPTPWSTRMMPLHLGMVRSQCQVLLSRGALTARHALTLRLSLPGTPADGVRQVPADGAQQAPAALAGLAALAARVAQQPGLVGLHVLRHQPPALPATTEQAIRGHADRAADWAIVACGYDAAALQQLGDADLGDAALQALGAAPGLQRGLYSLAYAATPSDLP